jgi:hypothetical protein
MFGRESIEVKKLKIELANQRRINARLRQGKAQPSAQLRILDQALGDALKLIDMHCTGESTTRQAVDGIVSRRRFSYAMALLKAGNIVRGGGRGEPYRWRRMPEQQMIDIAKGTHERLCNNGYLLLEHVPNHVRGRVVALSPTGIGLS